MTLRMTIMIAACGMLLWTTTACDKATAIAQTAKRAASAAKSLDEDGNSSDPKLKKLQNAVEQACNRLVECTRAAEKENDEAEGHNEEHYEAIESMCKNSKFIIIQASVGGAACVQALTDQFVCYADNDCETHREADPCNALTEESERTCSEFFEKFAD